MRIRTPMLNVMSIISVILFFTNFICYADQINNGVTYTINYAKNTKMKLPSLKNVRVKIQLYLGGNSLEKLTRITDQNQSFIITNRHASQHGSLLVVTVHSVEGASADVSCYGASLPGKTNIIISCHQRSEKKHYH